MQVLDEPEGREVACALLHELETLTRSHGSALIGLVRRVEDEDNLFPTWSIATKRALSCLSDPATRVLDLKPALLELKATDPLKYHRLYLPDGHMTAQGIILSPLKSPNSLAKVNVRRLIGAVFSLEH